MPTRATTCLLVMKPLNFEYNLLRLLTVYTYFDTLNTMLYLKIGIELKNIQKIANYSKNQSNIVIRNQELTGFLAPTILSR
jgi:hypothetical protein